MIPGDPLANTAPSLKLAGTKLNMVSACVESLMKGLVMVDRKAEINLATYHFWRS